MDPSQGVAYVAVGGGFAIAIIAMITGMVRYCVRVTAQERTKRDIAAYVAEGSMTPEQGERLIRATPTRSRFGCSDDKE